MGIPGFSVLDDFKLFHVAAYALVYEDFSASAMSVV